MPKPTTDDVGRVYRTRGGPGLWRWAKGHGPARWRLALEFAEDKVRLIRRKPRDAQGNLERWQTAEKVYRKRLQQARQNHRQHVKNHPHEPHQPQFEPWMLNGHPGNVIPAVERAIARAVIHHGSYTTATTDGTHATGSYHYPRNNPDPGTRAKNLGRAKDSGGTSAQYLGHFEEEKSRGASKYMELFGPQYGYIKNGIWNSGTSPDVPNHCHNAPALHA